MLRWLGFSFLLQYAMCADVKLRLPFATLTGKKDRTPKGKTYYSFQKIPFAEPPIGDLRFKAPVPKEHWKSVYDNRNDDVICYQAVEPIPSDFQGLESEDCLYLSIYTPYPKETKFGLPVLVYFYGGGFLAGGFVKKQYGPDFFIDENIIVALVNYRVGAFGFLSTNDTVIPGNAGLKDQLLGLRWIYENINYFGGNPSEITIGGESAGGASVIYLLMAKKAKGLFRGAISESGTALNLWAYQRYARNIAFQLAKIVDPTFISNDSKGLDDLLTSVSAEQIKNATLTLSNIVTLPVQALGGIIFAPVLEVEHEGAYITIKQYVTLDEGTDINKVPVLIGFSSEEAIGFGADLNTLKLLGQTLDSNPQSIIPYSLEVKPGVDSAVVAQDIKNIYVPNGTFADNPGPTIRYFSDTIWTRSIIKTGELLSKWCKVFFYQFSYSGVLGGPAIVVEGADRVGHVGEHNYIWRVTTSSFNNTDLSKFPKKDVITHYRLVHMFSNFVKVQIPSLSIFNLWPITRQLGKNHFLYMNINENVRVEDHPKKATYPKWNEIFLKDGVQPFTVF